MNTVIPFDKLPHASAIPSLRWSARMSEAAFVIAIAVATMWPVYAVACLALGAIALWSAVRTRIIIETHEKCEKARKCSLNWSININDIPNDPKRELGFLGIGYQVKKEHAVAMQQEIRADVPDAEDNVGGFRRDFCAVGVLGLRHFYVTLKTLSQHVFISGTTGSGKTKSLAAFYVALVRMGYSIIYVDPKTDADTTNLLASLAKMQGIPFHYINTLHPEKSDTYNPYDGSLAVQLFSMMMNLMPEGTKEKFWTETPSVASASAAAIHEVSARCIVCIKTEGENLEPSNDTDKKGIPKVYIAFGHALELATAQQRSEPTVDDVLAGWAFANGPHDLTQEDRHAARWFTTSAHVLNLSKFFDESAGNPRRVLAMVAKLLHPEAMIGCDPDSLQQFEEAKTKELKDQGKDKEFHLELADIVKAPMPWDERFQGAAWVKELWRPVIANRKVREFIDAQVRDLVNRVDSLAQWALTPREDRMKYCSSLMTACSQYLGRERVVAAENPQVNIGRIMRNQSILVVSTASTADTASSESFMKMILSNILGQSGMILTSGEKPVKCFCNFDEASMVANEQLRITLTQARASGVCVGVSVQEVNGLINKLGGEAPAKSIINNALLKIVLKSTDADECKRSSQYFGSVRYRDRSSGGLTIQHGLGQSGHKDIAGYSISQSINESFAEAPLAPPESIACLPVGHAYVQSNDTTYMVVMPQVVIPTELKVDVLAERGIAAPRAA